MSSIYLESLKSDIKKNEEQLEKELKNSTKSQVDEYHKIVTLYENTKTIILGEHNRLKAFEEDIAIENKEMTKAVAIYFGVTLFINIFIPDLLSRLFTIIIFVTLTGKQYLDFLLSATRFKKMNVENNIRILENDMEKYGVSNVGHHIYLHTDFIRRDEYLRNKGSSNDEVNKNESLEEMFRKVELDNLSNLTDILKNIKNNKRYYYVNASG